MKKICKKCGSVYSVTGGAIESPDGELLEISDISLCVNIKFLNGQTSLHEFNICPDCMEEVFKVIDPTMEAETDIDMILN